MHKKILDDIMPQAQAMATTKKTSKKSEPASKKAVSKTTSATVKSVKPKKSVRSKQVTASEMQLDSSSEAPKSRVITKKYLYAVVIVLIAIVLLFAFSRFWVVAWVDNKPITKFELYSLLEKRDEGKTADELIVQKLLMSEGQKKHQSVSDAEIEAEIKKVEEAQGGAAQLDQILSVNRTSREDFRKLVELQLIKQKLFGSDVNITDEEVNKYITDNKDSLPPVVVTNPESSEAAKLKEQVKEQLKQTKINENFNKWLDETMKSSRVVRMMPQPTPPSFAPMAPNAPEAPTAPEPAQ